MQTHHTKLHTIFRFDTKALHTESMKRLSSNNTRMSNKYKQEIDTYTQSQGSDSVELISGEEARLVRRAGRQGGEDNNSNNQGLPSRKFRAESPKVELMDSGSTNEANCFKTPVAAVICPTFFPCFTICFLFLSIAHLSLGWLYCCSAFRLSICLGITRRRLHTPFSGLVVRGAGVGVV